jgi:S-DNA-T family DNA segregation ATPase FtsK/SpoIIIE
VFHVTDPTIARATGLTGRTPPADVAGRLRIVESGLEAQVACDPAWPDHSPSDGSRGRAPGIDVLPELVEPGSFDRRLGHPGHSARPTASVGGTLLALGIGARDLVPSHLRVTRGDHVFIGGSAGTGKSTALRQLTFAWRAAHPDGVVVSLAAGAVDDPSRLTALRNAGSPLLVAVDDADRVDDTAGVLAELATRRDAEVTIIAAARLEAVRVAYGHWVREVTRSRCGLIMTSTGELDGELLGAVLPRRSMIPPRPGLAWMIDTRGPQLVQVAARMPT